MSSLYTERFNNISKENPLLKDGYLDQARTEFFTLAKRKSPAILQSPRPDAARILYREILNGKGALEHINEAIEVLIKDMYGWGPINELMQDTEVTDIWILKYNEILYEKNGRKYTWSNNFLSEEHLRNTAERMVASVGRKIDEARPVEDCRLPDGSRVVVVIPGVATRGTTVTIRKFSHLFTLEELSQRNLFPPHMVDMFKLMVKARINIYAAGGMGSGKNTFLNALTLCVDKDENLIFVEDPAESKVGEPDPERPKLPIPHVRVFEPRRAGVEGTGEVPLSLIFEKCLRMKPSRLLVSESRCPFTTYYTLQAMNIGHPGSMSSVHAESPEDVPIRLSDLLAAYPGGSYQQIEARSGKIAAVEIVVFLTQIKFSRRITDIVEIRRTEQGLPKVVPLYTFNFQGFNEKEDLVGELKFTNEEPEFLKKRKISYYLTKEEQSKLCSFFSVKKEQKGDKL